jgi:hypothetical protein
LHPLLAARQQALLASVAAAGGATAAAGPGAGAGKVGGAPLAPAPALGPHGLAGAALASPNAAALGINAQAHAQAAQQAQVGHAAASLLAVQMAQKQAAVSAALASLQGGVSAKPSRIYVGSVFFDVTEDDIKQIFQAFGPISKVSMIPNTETGKHKGYGFIEFEQHDAAAQAIQVMNGFTLANRQLKVGWANSALGTPGAGALEGGASVSDAAAAAAAAAASAVTPAGNAMALGQQAALLPDSANLAISSNAQRAHVMAKLSNRPSKVVLLKNMVDADDVDETLEEEITDECNKFGPVHKVIIATLEEAGMRLVKIFVQVAVCVFSGGGGG